MTDYSDPNREAVGLEPIWTGAGDEPEVQPEVQPETDPPAPEPEGKGPKGKRSEEAPTEDSTDKGG